jgi:transposase InsO family protein
VGKVWQLSAVDGASSFGIARVVAGDKTATVMARFLAENVVPACGRAGLTLGTATTDNGPEFGRAFGETCRLTGVRHHRIPPRSPNLNAFVERFGGDRPPPPLPDRLLLPLLHERGDDRRGSPGLAALL